LDDQKFYVIPWLFIPDEVLFRTQSQTCHACPQRIKEATAPEQV
jgi:hypothetical protein